MFYHNNKALDGGCRIDGSIAMIRERIGRSLRRGG
jgi:hypothetical protein